MLETMSLTATTMETSNVETTFDFGGRQEHLDWGFCGVQASGAMRRLTLGCEALKGTGGMAWVSFFVLKAYSSRCQ